MITIVGISTMALASGLILLDTGKAGKRAALALGLWLGVVTALAAASFFETRVSAFPPIPVRIAGSGLALLLASLLHPKARQLWDSIPTERLVLWHWTRLPIGLCFVVAASQGNLAPEFGHRAGWGDMLAGAWAIAAFLLPALRKRLPLLAWNVVGLADLLVAVGTAALTIDSPIQLYPYGELMRMMAGFPYALVPAFFVPVLAFTHILIFRRKN
jgi:hypothetical protein